MLDGLDGVKFVLLPSSPNLLFLFDEQLRQARLRAVYTRMSSPPPQVNTFPERRLLPSMNHLHNVCMICKDGVT